MNTVANLTRAIFSYVAIALRSANEESAARRIERCPLVPQNKFSCAYRALGQVDLTTRMAWGSTLMNPNHPLAAAVEALAIARAAIDAVQCNPAHGDDAARTIAWLEQMTTRAQHCALRYKVLTREDGHGARHSNEPTGSGGGAPGGT